jgi:hypothetical protein
MAAPGQTRGRTGRTGRLPWHRTMTVGITVLLFFGGGGVECASAHHPDGKPGRADRSEVKHNPDKAQVRGVPGRRPEAVIDRPLAV